MTDISIVTLPVDRWREFRRLRLEALSDSPRAFGASIERDMAHPDDYWINRLLEAQDGRGISLFAERDGELIGMVGAFFGDDPEVGNIVAMYVAPAWRGNGVGQMLVEAALDRLRGFEQAKRARLSVNAEQAAALALYLRCGFVEVARERRRMGDGQIYDELIMERSLR